MSKFKIGDRVRYINHMNNELYKEKGTVIAFNKFNEYALVHFDNKIPCGHNGRGMEDRKITVIDDNCWYCDNDFLSLMPEEIYKVGDKVVTNCDILMINPNGKQQTICKGSIGTVKGFQEILGITLINVKFENYKNNNSYVLESDIKPYIKPKSNKMVVNQFDNKIIATIDTEDGALVGSARCNPEDKFNFKTGMLIAIARAYGDKKLEEFVLHPDYFIEAIATTSNNAQITPLQIKGIKTDECKPSTFEKDNYLDALAYALQYLKEKKGD